MLTKFSELAVCDNQRSQGPQTSKGVLSVLRGRIFADWNVWRRGTTICKMLGVPDKLLDLLIVVFREEELFGFVDAIPEIFKKSLAFSRELRVWLGQEV